MSWPLSLATLAFGKLFGPLRRFNLAHPKLLILWERLWGASPLYVGSRRAVEDVGIAKRFPRAVGRAENLKLVFRAFHPRVISTARSVSSRFCSFLFLGRSAETIGFGTSFQNVSSIRNAIQQGFAQTSRWE